MQNLFPQEKITLNLPDTNIEFYPNFFSKEKADELFDLLYKNTPWQQDTITVYGKNHLQPRLTALYGNEGKPYKYSNIIMQPHAWNPTLIHIKELVEEKANQQFTTVLANLYRNERDSNGWHSDNEKELGRNPVIASVSFGEERVFQLKHNTNKNAKLSLNLSHGSLILMKEGSQIYYKHQIPKSSKSLNQRINLTFRTIL